MCPIPSPHRTGGWVHHHHQKHYCTQASFSKLRSWVSSDHQITDILSFHLKYCKKQFFLNWNHMCSGAGTMLRNCNRRMVSRASLFTFGFCFALISPASVGMGSPHIYFSVIDPHIVDGKLSWWSVICAYCCSFRSIEGTVRQNRKWNILFLNIAQILRS